MPGIRYLSEMFGGVPVVTTPAEIDIGTRDKLRVVLLEATNNGYPTVVVDMTGTRFCDCAVLTTLIRAHKRVLAEGSGLRLVVPADGVVPRILALSGIDRFIPCFASLEDALAQTPDGADPRPGPRTRDGSTSGRVVIVAVSDQVMVPIPAPQRAKSEPACASCRHRSVGR